MLLFNQPLDSFASLCSRIFLFLTFHTFDYDESVHLWTDCEMYPFFHATSTAHIRYTRQVSVDLGIGVYSFLQIKSSAVKLIHHQKSAVWIS